MSASHVIIEKVPPLARPASPGIRAVRAAVADRPVVPERLTLSLRTSATATDQAVQETSAAPRTAGTLTLPRPLQAAPQPDFTPMAVPHIDLESLPRSHRFMAVARPRWPWLFPEGDGWVPPLAIGVFEDIARELEGVLSRKLVRTGLHHWTKTWRYRRSLVSSVGRPRYSPDRTHGGKVSRDHAKLAAAVVAEQTAAVIAAKKAAAKAERKAHAKAARAAAKARQADQTLAAAV